MRIDEITVTTRFRKDMGDIDGLAQLLKERGQLVPIIVTSGKRLVKGWRRILAAKLLGWAEIWVVIIDDITDQLDFLLAQRDAHLGAKPLLLSEAMAMARGLLDMEQARAAQRMLAGRASSNLDKGRSDEKVAKFVGLGKDSFRRAMEICDAADRHPENENLQKITAFLNRGRRVKPAYDKFLKWKIPNDDATIGKTIPPLTRENIFEHYPVICDRFQNLEFKDKKFIFADGPWNQPQFYVDLAKRCAGDWLEQNGLLAVIVGALADGNNTWLRIAKLMSRYLNFRTEIVLHTPGVSNFVPVINSNRNHLLILLFHRKDATNPQPESLKRSLVTSYLLDGTTGKDKRYHDWGRTVGGHMQILEVCTIPGDEVLDIGAGGGTMAEACQRTNRTCISVEDHEDDCEKIRNRILAVWSELEGKQVSTNPSAPPAIALAQASDSQIEVGDSTLEAAVR